MSANSEPLFDSAATEYVCTHGHGTLTIPHPALETLTPLRWRGPERWWLDLVGPPATRS